MSKIREMIKKNKDILIYTLLGSISQILNAVPPIIIAFKLTASEFGSYSLAKMIMLFFLSLLFSSSQTPFVISAQREYMETKRISKSIYIQLIIYLGGILLIILSELFLSKYFQSFAEISVRANIFLVTTLITVVTKNFMMSILLSTERRRKSIILDIVYNIILNVLIVVGIFLNKINIENIFIIYTISGLVSILLYLPSLKIKSICKLEIVKNIREIRSFVKFTLWQIFGFVGIYLSNWGDNFVLKSHVSMGSIGVYNFMYGIYAAAISIAYLVAGYFTPDITKNSDNIEYLKKYLKKKRWLLTLLYSICCGIVVLILPYILNKIYQGKYNEGFIFIYTFIPISIIFFYNMFTIPIFNTANKYKLVQITNIITVAINLIIDLILIPKIGISGTIYARIVSVTSQMLILEVMVRKHIKEMEKAKDN